MAVPLHGLIGFFMGSSRAAVLLLDAQVALCQVQIEHNNRVLSEDAVAAPITDRFPKEAVAAYDDYARDSGDWLSWSGDAPRTSRTRATPCSMIARVSSHGR